MLIDLKFSYIVHGSYHDVYQGRPAIGFVPLLVCMVETRWYTPWMPGSHLFHIGNSFVQINFKVITTGVKGSQVAWIPSFSMFSCVRVFEMIDVQYWSQKRDLRQS